MAEPRTGDLKFEQDRFDTRSLIVITMSEAEIINPIHPEYLPRLSEDFVKLYNENAAIRLATHQVPIEEVSLWVLMLLMTVASKSDEVFFCIRHTPSSESSP